MLPVLFLTTRYIRAGGFFIFSQMSVKPAFFHHGSLATSCCCVIIVEELESGHMHKNSTLAAGS